MTKSHHNPTFKFEFPDLNSASLFYQFARSQDRSTNVQYPLSSDGNGGRDCKQVLVTGVGSLIFDMRLKKLLEDKANELGGVMVDKG